MARVLVISNLFSPYELGGYEILARQVCEGLVELGHDVAVLCARGARPPGAPYDVWPELVLTAPFELRDDRSRRRRAWVHARNARATRIAVDRHGAGAVLSFSLRRLTLGPARAVEGLDVARLFVVNDAWPLAYRPRPAAPGVLPTLSRWLDRSLLATTTTLGTRLAPALVLSRSLHEELARGGVAMAAAAITYQGVSTERFRPGRRGPRARCTRLLYAGQLHRYKGVHDLLEAVRVLERAASPPELSVTIAGKGDPAYERELRARARDLHCAVDFVGHVEFEAMPALYRAHDLLVFPSVWNEPLGLTHLEAMACGVPAVVARSGGCGELVERCPQLPSYAPGDVEGLAAVLRPLLASPQERERLGASCREWVARHASLRGYVSRIESALGIRAGEAMSAPITP